VATFTRSWDKLMASSVEGPGPKTYNLAEIEFWIHVYFAILPLHPKYQQTTKVRDKERMFSPFVLLAKRLTRGISLGHLTL
jgi:hypothetical protein